ncbi:MAG: hypothetical protein SGPRY_003291, partial [Prymnesium sp.]
PLVQPCEDIAEADWVDACSEPELEEWLSSLQWLPFHLCLQHALLQTTLCFADRRFELRRMADQADASPPPAPSSLAQVLRPLTELTLWADLPVLQQLWAYFLPHVDSLPCWVVKLVESASSDKVRVLGAHLLLFLHARFSHQLKGTLRQRQSHFGMLLRLLHAVHTEVSSNSSRSLSQGSERTSGREEGHLRAQVPAVVIR